MPLRRFDASRLQAVPPSAVTARRCPRSDALVAACRQGALAGPDRQAFRLLQTDDAELARRACLELDGSWAMADAFAPGRLLIRARALAADLAWWRPPRAHDAWDAGMAPNPGALAGFEPRRATLIVIDGEPGQAGWQALSDIEGRAAALRCVVRVLCVQAQVNSAPKVSLPEVECAKREI